MPYAADQLSEIENDVINHTSAFNRDLTVSAPLPRGGRQVTLATAYDPHSRALLHVTLDSIRRNHQPRQIVFADRAEFAADKWVLQNASAFTVSIPTARRSRNLASPNSRSKSARIQPTSSNDSATTIPENMSRAEIADIVHSGQLTRERAAQVRHNLSRETGAAVRVLRLHPDRDSVRPALDSRRRQHEPRLRSFAGDRVRLLHRHDDLLVLGRSLSAAGAACGPGCRT